jgi:PKD repeat protein
LTTLVVPNKPPAIDSILAPMDPVSVNTVVSVSAPFTDPNVLDTHTAVWNWGDGSTSPGLVTETNGAGTVAGSHAYTAAGVYTISLTVTDNAGESAQAFYQYVVAYDPSAGFVTGGGWINSPAGAYAANPALTGKANFGFVSKYQKGATTPTGETEFHAAGFDFHSTVYEWLVISGTKAQYKGTGTVNGSLGPDGVSGYGFLLTTNDGQLTGGGGVDKFRIKIWDKLTGAVVYDNVLDPTATDSIDNAKPQTIAGGNILIHK